VTSKADFNAEDWSTVVDGPLYAGVRVIAADRGGTLRESVAMSRVYQEARTHHGDSPLLDELLKAPPTIDAQRVQSAGDIAAVTTEHMRKAMGILEHTATQAETDAYKTFVMTVAQAVAGAHKEGGFLGIGGTAVSEAEEQALDEIAAALGSPPPAAATS
jgi:hypothetical protein